MTVAGNVIHNACSVRIIFTQLSILIFLNLDRNVWYVFGKDWLRELIFSGYNFKFTVKGDGHVEHNLPLKQELQDER